MLLFFLIKACFDVIGGPHYPVYFELYPLWPSFILIEALVVTLHFELEPMLLLLYFNLGPCSSGFILIVTLVAPLYFELKLCSQAIVATLCQPCQPLKIFIYCHFNLQCSF